MNSKKWSSNPLNSPVTSFKNFFLMPLLSVLFAFSFSGCNNTKVPFLICEEPGCSYKALMSGFIEIESEKKKVIKKISEKGLTEINIPGTGLTPVTYSSKDDLFLLKGMDDSGLIIEIYSQSQKKTLKSVNLPNFITALSSACFVDDGNLWLLHTQEREDTPRRFVLSKSEESYENWTNYLLREESDENWLRRIFSLGSPVERPVSIACGKEKVYILTHQYFQDTMKIKVYFFDTEQRELVYETSFFPVDEKGKVSVHYSINDSILYVFQSRQLTTVKENDFPDMILFDEPGEMFFSEDEEGVLMLFVPDTPKEGVTKGRLMKSRFTDSIKP